MNAELKKKWVDALRSGDYQQGEGLLRDYQDHYCCLGVLADVNGEEWVRTPGYYGNFKVKRTGSGLSYGTGCGINSYRIKQLVGLNDSGGDFNTIADYIEENL